MTPKSLQLQNKNSFYNVLGRIEDYFFPRLCILCDTPRNSQQHWFCSSCHEKLLNNHHNRTNYCHKCAQNKAHRVCACDLAWDYPFEEIFSFLDYDELVQKIMHHIKYYGKNKLAWYMGKIMSEYLPPNFFDGFDIITAVPLHWKREFTRGYNQAHWLASGFVYNRDFPKLKANIIKRQRYTKTQTKLDKTQRQKNINGAFVLNPSYLCRLKGKSVILVDDVVTTGATTSICTQELLKSGCSRVKVLSLTRD